MNTKRLPFYDWLLISLTLAAWPAITPRSQGPSFGSSSKSELHMGVEFEIVLYAADVQAAEAAIAKGFARIAALDQVMSDYDPLSELSKLGELAAAKPTSLSDELWQVLQHSQELSSQSGGAFDVTIGPLSKLWRRARRQNELPGADRLAEARASVGFKFLKLDSPHHTAQFLRPNMRLDLAALPRASQPTKLWQ